MRKALFLISFNLNILFCQSIYSDLNNNQKKWVDSIYSSLTLEEKVGQLFINWVSPERSNFDEIKELVVKDKIGGLIFSIGTTSSHIEWLNKFQSLSKTPLLITMDAEWGPSQRLSDVFAHPWNMTLGAIEDNTLVQEISKRMAEQNKALGINYNFSPSVDVNNNSKNPIIGNRSFGEDPVNVYEKAKAYIKGHNEVGIFTSIKHFPGHGDTDKDSHKTLPVINGDMDRLNSIELYPFKKLIDDNLAQSIMTAHLSVPAIDKKYPSSLSDKTINKLIRNDLGFDGITVTDALDMKGVLQDPNINVDLRAFEVGNDIILMSTDVSLGIKLISEKIKKGKIAKEKLEKSVKKILSLKAKSGLLSFKEIESHNILNKVNTDKDTLLYSKAMESAITLLKNKSDIIPLHNNKKYLHVSFGSSSKYLNDQLNLYNKIDSFDSDDYSSLFQKLDYDGIIVSEYIDLTILGDYYTNGSYGVNLSSTYKKRYGYSGNFTARFENLINGERGLPDYSKSTVYNFRWSHSKDSKSSPLSSFSASVNFGSSDYFRQSVNQLNTSNFLNNNLSSSIAYSKRFNGSAGLRLSLNANMSQNTQSKQVNLTLPTLTLSTDRFYPFEKKGKSKKGFIQNINIQYSSKAENRAVFSDDLLLKKGMFDDAKNGMQHNIPFTTNFKLLKHLSVSMGGNLQENWFFKTIKFNDYSDENPVSKDTISGFDRFLTYNYSGSITTKIYGIVNFKPKNKIQSIRHTLTPSITFSNRPSFDQYYDTYIIDANGNTREYTRFQEGLYSAPGRNKSSVIGINIKNTLEAKVKQKDTTKTTLRKVEIFKNLNIATSYNLTVDEFKIQPVRVTGSISLARGLVLNTGATFDPYALDENNQRINVLNIKNGGGLLRLTSANISTQYMINNQTFKRGQNQEQINESTSGGGRSDDLFGVSQDFSNSNQFLEEEEQEEIDLDRYYYTLPWSLNLAYSLTYNNSRGQKDFSTNSLMLSSNLSLTPKWKVGISSGYDFKQKGFTYTQLRFDRDLDSWRLNFSWVPFSQRASWNFFIGIKSGLLSDLKYEKRSEPDRTL